MSQRARWRSALVGVGLLVSACTADPLAVETTSGAVRGITEDGLRKYLGIPYAEPPVGALRFAAPAPAARWDGVREATSFGPACPQQARFGITEASLDEDCLSINVVVPDRPSPSLRPVMVWIHGGAFVGGASRLYDLDLLARAGDIVVVSFNYRVGALGLLAHPRFDRSVDGSFGLADQRLALQWVQGNIAAFGGDPARVTVAGESAGAASTCVLVTNPEATAGLFQRAILQSFGCMAEFPRVEQQHPLGVAFAAQASVGCPDDAQLLTCLRSVPVERLLEA
jgi:para-nitrobenzyl esterase